VAIVARAELGPARNQEFLAAFDMRVSTRMATLNSYRELLVWQKSMTLAERGFRMTRRFKRDDQLVLGHEIRKSCVSIPQTSRKASDGITRRSTSTIFDEEIGRMLRGLIGSLERTTRYTSIACHCSLWPFTL
jgi:23S rRNA-intervening sequence protein